MIIVRKDLPYRKHKDEVRIKILSDVHLGHECCDMGAVKRFLTPDAYYIGLGDLMDSIIVPDYRYRKSLDATYGEAVIDEQIRGIMELLWPIKGRILGLGTGNHEDTILRKCGTDPTRRLCDLLGTPYLGYSWILVLRLFFNTSGNATRTVRIRGHHGWGGGSRTRGYPLTKYHRDTEHWEADIFLYGHDHRRLYDKVTRFGISGTRLIPKHKHIVLGGTFLRSYSENPEPTYAERLGMPPTTIGGPTIVLRPYTRPAIVDVEVEA